MKEVKGPCYLRGKLGKDPNIMTWLKSMSTNRASYPIHKSLSLQDIPLDKAEKELIETPSYTCRCLVNYIDPKTGENININLSMSHPKRGAWALEKEDDIPETCYLTCGNKTLLGKLRKAHSSQK